MPRLPALIAFVAAASCSDSAKVRHAPPSEVVDVVTLEKARAPQFRDVMQVIDSSRPDLSNCVDTLRLRREAQRRTLDVELALVSDGRTVRVMDAIPRRRDTLPAMPSLSECARSALERTSVVSHSRRRYAMRVVIHLCVQRDRPGM